MFFKRKKKGKNMEKIITCIQKKNFCIEELQNLINKDNNIFF